MDRMSRKLSGAGGGGGSGSSPTRTPDNLLSTDLVEFTLGITEGPIAGLQEGPKSFYLDDTALVSADGRTNFTPFQLHLYHGDPTATPIGNVLGGVSSNTVVGQRLEGGIAVTRTTNSTLRNQIDSLEVRLNFNQLLKTNENGDQLEHEMVFAIEYRAVGSATFEKFYGSNIKLTGKTTSGYARDFTIKVPRVETDWEIKVTKFNLEAQEFLTTEMTWESFQMVTAGNKSYDNLAVVRGIGEAGDQFPSIPQFSGVYAAKLVLVPSNYDSLTRHYNGVWDGTFTLAHTDNPAWIVYDLCINDTYGFRRYYPNLKIDRFSTYEWGKWCDELVPRPGGGYQPRWTYNDSITASRNAMDLLYYICGATGAVPISDMNGTVSFKIDKPESAIQIFGLESVTTQGFNYQFTAIEQRPNDITVKFVNPNLDWNEDVRRVHNDNWINKNGRITEDLIAIGCNDVYEAQRRAFRRLVQANTETVTVNFSTARAGIKLEAFDVVGLVDPEMNWGLSGRIKSVEASTIYLRDALFVPVNEPLELTVQTNDGPVDLVVEASQPNATELTITNGSMPAGLPEFAQFALTSEALGLVKPFRILSVEESTSNPELVTVSALEVNVNKYGDIDNMELSDSVDFETKYGKFPPTPVITSVVSGPHYSLLLPDGTREYRMFVVIDPGLYHESREYTYWVKDVVNGDVLEATGPTAQKFFGGLTPKRDYELTVQAKSLSGLSAVSDTVFHTLEGKGNDVPALTQWEGRSLIGGVELSGPAPTLLDFKEFEVFAYDHDDQPLFLNSVIRSPSTIIAFDTTNFMPEPTSYRVRAVDREGNHGEFSAHIFVQARKIGEIDLSDAFWDELGVRTQADLDEYNSDFDDSFREFESSLTKLDLDFGKINFDFDRIAELNISAQVNQTLEDARVEGVVDEQKISLTAAIGDVSSDLAMNYYTAATVDEAVAASELTLNSAIEGVAADLSNNYYTIANSDEAIAASELTLNSAIGGVAADLSNNYYTVANTDEAIAASELTLNSAIGGVAADLSNNYYTVANTDEAIAASELTLNSAIGGVAADLSNNYYTVANTDAAISASELTLNSTIDDVSANLTNNYQTEATTTQAIAASEFALNSTIDDVSANLTNNYQTSATTTEAITASELTLNSAIGGVAADLSNNYYTGATTESAITAKTSVLQSSINGNTTNISTTTNSVNGVRAQHGVRINNNGAMSGFGLISNLEDGGVTSDFFVDADTFRIGTSSSTGAYASPFQVTGGNTYIRDAFIQNASVGTLKIGDDAVTVTTVSTRGDQATGGSGTLHVHSGRVYLDQPGYVLITWTGNHGYFNADFSNAYPHNLELRINGATAWTRDSGAINDYPSISYALFVWAGWTNVDIYWSGSGNQIVLGSRVLTIQGAKR
jgi:predicted phage tail protein